jgi:LPS sulfotransferase NodH
MKEYRKYLLLTSPRSGTHMLKSSLEAHPNIICLTEMFNPDYIQGKYPYDDRLPAKQVLDKFIYCDYKPEIKAVGFCLHRSGARFGNWPRLWNILKEMPDLYVISLYRENLLRRYMSVQLQQITNLKTAKIEPRDFDLEILIQEFQKQISKREEFNHRFSEHPIIQVSYESLCNDYQTTINKVQEFLGVPITELKPGTGKRQNPPMSQYIKNYQELKERLTGTEWETFFDD